METQKFIIKTQLKQIQNYLNNFINLNSISILNFFNITLKPSSSSLPLVIPSPSFLIAATPSS